MNVAIQKTKNREHNNDKNCKNIILFPKIMFRNNLHDIKDMFLKTSFFLQN